MTRSLKKGPWVDPNVLKKLENAKPGDSKPIKTWSRASTITPEMVGYRFAVHQGKDFVQFVVIEDMVGHKLGEFAPTRKFVGHGGKMAKSKDGK